MNPLPRLTLGVVLLLGLSFSSCNTQKPLSSVDRSRYRTVAIDPQIKAPDHYVYRDITGRRARGLGGQFGLLGALVGGAIGASSEGSGYERFDRSASQFQVDIRSVVRMKITQTLETSRMFALVKASPDAVFQIEILAYGVAPTDGHNLGGVIAAKATLVSRESKTLWEKQESGISQASAPLETYQANPKLWAKVADEAAADLARKLILYNEEDQRQPTPLAL